MANAGPKKLAIVGVGLMGSVLLERLLTARFCGQQEVIACDSDAERRKSTAERYGVEVCEQNSRAAEAPTIIVAVPPGQVSAVLKEFAHKLTPRHLLVSVAAAVPISVMESCVGENVPVVRALPNTPSLVGQGITPVSFGSLVTDEARAATYDLLRCWGDVIEVPESAMNLCVGLTAAAPTFIFAVIEALARVGKEGGFDEERALKMSAHVVHGAAALVLESGRSLQALEKLTPLHTLRKTEAMVLFSEAVETARSRMERLQEKLSAEWWL